MDEGKAISGVSRSQVIGRVSLPDGHVTDRIG
jgi:hypothetical protein